MNKYQELIRTIIDNNLKIIKENGYDASSGWHSEDFYICDGDTIICNLSGNGFCFNDDNVEKGFEKIKKYLEEKNVTTLDAFRKWVDNHSVRKTSNR